MRYDVYLTVCCVSACLFLWSVVVAVSAAGGGLSLTDFAKQRQQEAELEQQLRDEGDERGGGGEQNQDSFGEGEGESSDEPEDLGDIQREREKEFLDLFCEPVHQFPEDIASSIVEELADRLHHMLTSAVDQETNAGGQRHVLPDMDPDDFDEVVVRCLQAEELQTDMAAARDLMLTYVQDRM